MDEQKTTAEQPKESPESKAGKSKLKLTRGKIISLVVILIIIWFGAIQIMAAERYEAIVNVVEGDNKVGVNPTSERLDFGDLSRDTGAAKNVTIKNTGQSDKKIIVIKRGAISELMKVNKSNFVLKAGEETKIEFSVQIPVSAPYQKYAGQVMIFKLPNWF